MLYANMPASTFLLSILLLLLSQFSRVLAFAQCYYPDGSIPTDYVWEPCTGDEFSSCCVPSEGDVCQRNGLCWYPLDGNTYRGTCTDRTWNSSACAPDICVKGFETTWNWAAQCSENGSSNYMCGSIADGQRTAATCNAQATAITTGYRTRTTTSVASRYVSPPPIDTSLYSLYTDTYTTIITANVQTTTLTSTFESTMTSTLSQSTSISPASVSTASGSAASTGVAVVKNGANRVTLTTGILAAIIAGPILAIAIGLAIFFWLRKRSSRNLIKLPDQAPYPPPNGPVGADQVHPYEVDVNEATGVPAQRKYNYIAPVEQPYEVDAPYGAKEEEKWGQAVKMGGYEYRGSSPMASPSMEPRSPAPAYTRELVAVELDGTSRGSY